LIGEHVGQRNLAVTASTYTHVLTDEQELDYERMLAWASVLECTLSVGCSKRFRAFDRTPGRRCPVDAGFSGRC